MFTVAHDLTAFISRTRKVSEGDACTVMGGGRCANDGLTRREQPADLYVMINAGHSFSPSWTQILKATRQSGAGVRTAPLTKSS